MSFKTLMMSTAIAAALSGGVLAQTATDTADPTIPPAADGMADGTAAVPPAPQTLEEMTVGDVLGTPVTSGDGEDVGEIDYVIILPDGTTGAVIGIGGFLGLGEYTVALPIEEFSYNAEERTFVVSLSKEQLESTPEFDESGVEGLPDETRVADLMSRDAPATDDTAAAEAPEAPAAPAESEAAEAPEAPTEEVETGETEMASDAAEPAAESDPAAVAPETDQAAAEPDASEGIAAPATDAQMADAAKPFEALSVAETIGTKVVTASGEDVGEIDYVVKQADDKIGAVIGIGGFLGVGEYTVSLPLDRFTYNEEEKILEVTMSEEELRQVPEYDEAAAEDEKLPKDMILGDVMSAEQQSN